MSELVLVEARAGDPKMASRRLAQMREIPILAWDDEATKLANRFLNSGLIPSKAIDDALHVALASVKRIDYLLTWNCRHIANAEIIRGLEKACKDAAHQLPTLCTPEQLMGD